MAVSYYFFDAKKTEGGGYDRTYSAGDFAKYLDGLVGSGVFPIPSTSLQVYSGTGMTVKVKPGMGWINGHKMINDADLVLNIDAADVTLNRIDRIVFRLNLTNRDMGIYVKKGTNASSPVAPTVERTGYIEEYSLATITINKQTTQITESMIRDTRLDSSVCGMVQGLVQQASTATLYKQWNDAYDRAMATDQKEFDDWFANVKDSLSTAVMWQELKNVVVTETTNVKTMNIGIPQYNDAVDILTVYVNGMRLDKTEYTSDTTTITFTDALTVIGTTVEIVVYKCVNGEGAETILGQVTKLQQEVVTLQAESTQIQNSFKQPTSLYDGSLTPETTGAIKYLSIPTLSTYDIIIVRLTIGTIGEQMLYFYKGTASSGKINQSFSAFLNATTYGTATVQYDNTANRIGVRAESVQTWTNQQIVVKKVWGIKL